MNHKYIDGNLIFDCIPVRMTAMITLAMALLFACNLIPLFSIILMAGLVFVLVGPPASGKTHLVRVWQGRAGAIALDPEILYFDEPSAGLDPISSHLLDDLILELRESLGTTFVVVTHELASIFAIASKAIFLDTVTRTATAIGPPAELRDHSQDPAVRAFLRRGEEEHE